LVGATRSQHLLQKAVIESLELRTMLSSYWVANSAASGTGSLAQVIANADSDPDATIYFNQGVTSVALAGTPLTINEVPGGTMTIDGGDGVTLSGSGQSGVFLNDSGSTVVLENLTLTDGKNTQALFMESPGGSQTYVSGGGGAVTNLGTLTVNNSTITGNTSPMGGGILNTGTLTLLDSTVSNNTSAVISFRVGFGGPPVSSFQGQGGGIDSTGNLTVANSTISGNIAANGGGLYTSGTATTITSSTIADNSADYWGGGVYSKGPVTITSSTVSANLAGCAPNAGSTNLQSPYDSLGGGIASITVSQSNFTPIDLLLENSIVSGNTSQVTDTESDVSGIATYSRDDLIGDGSAIDLAPLGYYGGPTETMPLLPGSPAIGAGDDITGTTDQRGFPIGSAPDIGAFQTQSVTDTGFNPLDVNTAADDPVGTGQLSLRDAANLASVLGGAQTISFAIPFAVWNPTTPTMIDLQGDAIPLDDTTGTLTINGNDTGDPIIVNACNSTGVFSVAAGSSAAIDGLTLGGLVTDNGQLTAGGDSPATGANLALNVSFGATFSPGPSLTLSSLWVAGTYNANITSDILGSGYQQVAVTGGVSLTPASVLDLSNVDPSLQIQDQLTLITAVNGFAGTAFSNVREGSTVTVGSETCLATYLGGNSQSDLSLFCTQAPCSIVQQDASIIAGEPANFELLAAGPGAANITSWLVNFEDGRTDSTLTINTTDTPPASVQGGVYQWDVQHIFPSKTDISIESTCHMPDDPSAMCSLPIVVDAAPSSPLVSVTGAVAESSTQVYVQWSNNNTNVVYDSYEVAAANDSSGTYSNYTVVAAASGADTSVLVTGLTPDTGYRFFVYGITGAGSNCSNGWASAFTPAAPTMSTGVAISGHSESFHYSVAGGLSNASYSWQGFDSSGNADSLAAGGGEDAIGFATTQQLSSITVVITPPASYPQAGAFDSVTWYNTPPTIVVTGTSGDDNFVVSDNNGAGPYTITGGVTPIAPFYAPSIDLQVQGRGGNDTLTVSGDATVTMTSDPSAGGTTLTTTETTGATCHAWLYVGNIYTTAPESGLLLPAPVAPDDSVSLTSGDSFTPPVSSSAVSAGAIEQATATAGPGDVIALTVEDYNSNTQFWVYGQTGSYNADWERATLVSNASAGVNTAGLALEAVSIQMPGDLPANSVYLLYELNGSAYSQPYVINQPQIWWADTNNAYVGGKVSLFGTNLSYDFSQQPHGSDQSWAYLFPENSAGVVDGPPIPVTATAVPASSTGSGAVDVNPYKVDINLPADLEANTTYEVEVYNGHGGEYGLSNAFPITVAAAPTPPVSATYSLQAAYDDSNAAFGLPLGSIYLNGTGGPINPAALNAAIVWASGESIYAGVAYVTIDMPVGLVEVTAASGPIVLYPNVHLVGAGDTQDPATGTVMEAAPGAGVEGVVELNNLLEIKWGNEYGVDVYPNGSWASESNEIQFMSIDANGGISEAEFTAPDGSTYYAWGVIFDNGGLEGLTIDTVTIDATTDDPANPSPLENGLALPDVYFGTNTSYSQFLNSTFLGAGVDINHVVDCTFDNDHFFGSGGYPTAVIGASGALGISVTRCTAQSLVNNITSPGGNVEFDAADRLLWCGVFNADAYAGDNTTSDLYQTTVQYGLNGGEQILVEPGNEYAQKVAVYQNTLSGDGAESFLSNGCGVGAEGVNVVVDDNDISNVNAGIIFEMGGVGSEASFGMFANNSIHNVYIGVSLQITTSTSSVNTPWCVGNSFSDNTINGIRVGPSYQQVSAAIYIVTYALQSNNPSQMLMNVFDGDTVTGASVGVELLNMAVGLGGETGTVVVSNGIFEASGSAETYGLDSSDAFALGPCWLADFSGYSQSPIVTYGDADEGYWNIYV
jgi:hypothetical protein